MKRIIFAVSFTVTTLMGCNFGFSKGEGGLLYKVIEDKDGDNIQDGDFLSINVVVKTDKDSVLFSSYDAGRPQMMLVRKPSYKGDLYDALTLLSEGDSAVFKLATDTMFTRTGQPRPPQLKEVKYMVYQIKIEKSISKKGLTEEAFQAKVSAFFKDESETASKEEERLRKQYITSNKLQPTVTNSGLNYIITRPGVGIKPGVGDSVEVHYTGKLLNGKVFDTSVKAVAEKNKIYDGMRPYTPIKFPVGTGRVIQGWDEALLMLNKGTRALLIIPSKLAYGEQGAGEIIAPFSTLVFEIEVINIIPSKKK